MNARTRSVTRNRAQVAKRPAVSARAPEVRRQSQVEAFAKLAPGNYHRISKASGLSLQHVSRVLRGIRGATLTTAARIARGAGVTMDQLLAYRAMNGADLDRPFDSAA